MTQEIIDIGALANDGTGDPLRTAFDKINNNFAELYSTSSVSPPNGSIQYAVENISGNNVTYSLGSSANLTFNSSTNSIVVRGNIVPLVSGQLNLGSSSSLIGNLYLQNNALRIGQISVNTTNNTVTLNSGPNTKASLEVASISGDQLNVTNTAIGGVTANTIGGTQGQVIWQINEGSMKSGVFEIKSQSVDSSLNQSTTIVINRNSLGTGVKYNAYGTLFNGNPITSYDVDVAFGFIRVKINPLVNQNITHSISYKLVN